MAAESRVKRRDLMVYAVRFVYRLHLQVYARSMDPFQIRLPHDYYTQTISSPQHVKTLLTKRRKEVCPRARHNVAALPSFPFVRFASPTQ